MLSIGAIGRPGYFLEIATRDYYTAGGERPGEWLVASGLRSRFDGEVTKDALENILSGCSRDGRTRLLKPHPKRKKGWDLTFSAPKSVSVLYALAPRRVREEVLKAHRAAVEAAVRYLVREALWARRGKAGGRFERIDKAVFSCFTHVSSRAGDPDLHDHVLLANLGLRADGTTGALWSHDLYRHTRSIGAVYRVELAHQLQQRLGVIVYRVRDWFELRGIPAKVRRHFSRRSEEIRNIAREYGESHPKFLELLTKITRGIKGHLPHRELLADWAKRAARLGLGPVHIANMLNIWRPKLSEERARRTAYKAASQAIATLAQRRSYFTERQIIQAATPYVMGKGRGAELLLQAAEIAKRQLVLLETPGERYPHFTTMELYNTEIRVMRIAARLGRQAGNAWVSFSELLKTLDKSAEFSLDADKRAQRVERLNMEAAVRYLVNSRERVRVIFGRQQSGKTTALKLAKQAYEKAGFDVVACAPTAAAARELRRQLGGDCVTVHKLLDAVSPSYQRRLSHAARQTYRVLRGRRPWRRNERRLEVEEKPVHYYRQLVRMLKGKLPRYPGKLSLHKKTVILIDEAQRLDTRSAHDLLKVAEKRGCSLRIAYTKDSPAGGGPGGAAAQIAKKVGAHPLRQTTRQGLKGWQVAAHNALRRGDSETFLKKYRCKKALKELPTERRAIAAVAKAWVQDRATKPRDKLVIASDAEQVDKLNRAIQKSRAPLGVPLGGVKMPTGDVVRTGDRVRFGRNSKRLGVEAGDMGRVINVARSVKNPKRRKVWVRVDDKKRFWVLPKVVVVDTLRYKDLKLGYALLPTQVQSKVNSALVLLNGTKASRESVLHQVTRAENKTRLFAVRSTLTRDVDVLAQNLAKSQQKRFAHRLEADRKRRFEQQRTQQHAETGRGYAQAM